MDIETVKNVIKRLKAGHSDFCIKADIANRYYACKNDILFCDKNKERETEPLHKADNRVCSSLYNLLVNQKSSYMFTAPPLFDVGDKSANKLIAEQLGDKYAKNCKSLCIKASNEGLSWVHYYIKDNKFTWAVLDGKNVIPIFNDDLNVDLIGVLRVFQRVDELTGSVYEVCQLWTDTECCAYEYDITNNIDNGLRPYNMFYIDNTLISGTEPTNYYKNPFGKVPFIAFYNNDLMSSDLENIKGLIDTYDKTYSGFANDLEDIQEVIMILTGYEGEDLKSFLADLKKYKTVKLDADDNSSLQTLTIDIPVEAREKLLTMTRKAIFEQGQGVDPDPGNFGNSSGVALKYLYSLLELKAGLLETEFRLGFAKLVRAICDYMQIPCDKIEQIWTRTSINNDTELAQIATQSQGIISNETIVKNHPWVESPEKELAQIKQESQEQSTITVDGIKVGGNSDEE